MCAGKRRETSSESLGVTKLSSSWPAGPPLHAALSCFGASTSPLLTKAVVFALSPFTLYLTGTGAVWVLEGTGLPCSYLSLLIAMAFILSAGCSALSMGCCAVQTCCTLASCCGCKPSSSASKALYIGIYFVCAVLAVILRYYGQQALQTWISVISVCDGGACWGQQADYRISGALFAFFLIMTVLTAAWRAAHTGAWFLKLIFFIGLLAVTLAIPNSFWDGYSQFSRYGSIIFMVLQVRGVVPFGPFQASVS